ncbi:hypothetical protein ASPTUDRAFT_841524 [Aspergillus tubingensis CBS 134.48]|uniref:Uncharacterized protein n=1 Tax=Aspergillus tubingensis (strain CBS 134.48) TaxID=767770 RepID=A0A1L9MTH3_ASPTC|nr:hypothetical protein ASPTUDRAFT_841524 [Aspergillus tubingensis CBS 134.48]
MTPGLISIQLDSYLTQYLLLLLLFAFYVYSCFSDIALDSNAATHRGRAQQRRRFRLHGLEPRSMLTSNTPTLSPHIGRGRPSIPSSIWPSENL